MKITRKPRVLNERSRRAFDRAVDDTLREARRIAPVRTGKYKRSLSRTEVNDLGNGKLEAKVYSPLASALIKEKGGTIRARVAKYLAIPSQDGGIRMVKQVRIRATPTVTKAGPKFTTYMTRRLKEASR